LKSVREVPIADHLWEVLERMAEEMGTGRDALVNQALHVFARLNGFLVPGAAAVAPAPPPVREERRAEKEGVLAAAARLERDLRPAPRPPSAVPTVPAAPPAPPAPVPAAAGAPDAPPVLVPVARQAAQAAPFAPSAPRAAALVLEREDGTELPIEKERFVIGRGRHCDLVVDSAKVSREHAAVVREPGGWTIEDLGSSNGTWFRRERITRRRIEDGDEYFVSAEKIRCVLR
jgi:hypothetical protein